MKETDVTIISTNLNKELLNSYKDYFIIDGNFTYQELLKNKKVIFFNNLNNLTNEKLEKLFKYLKENDLNFIVCTNNLEISLYTKYLTVCDKKNILIEGKTVEVLKNDKLLKRLGFELPFIIDLSIFLKGYNLIDGVYLSKERLVEKLWT